MTCSIEDNDMFEPISSVTTADGWSAIFATDGEICSETHLVGWVLCKRVTVTTLTDKPFTEMNRERQPNCIAGLVVGELGVEVAENISNFLGYRHYTMSLERFMDTYSPTDNAK